MADVDEDAVGLVPPGHSGNDHNDISDEPQDFRFLAALTSGLGEPLKIPKRGEKDFESHGTKHQEAMLEASRQAMQDVLSYMRVHPPRSKCRAWYFGDGVLDEDGGGDGIDGPLDEAVRGTGLNRNHIVMVESAHGTHFRSMGTAARGKGAGKQWLLPEEALYLVERGNLDLWWPSSPMKAVMGQTGEYGVDQDQGDEDDGLSLSLQAAYALLIGEDGEDGTISLDQFTVYSHLRRLGYAVLRERQAEASNDSRPQNMSLFTRLYGALFSHKASEPHPHGPLIKPGLYRSYHQIYQLLSVIPIHKPSPSANTSGTPPPAPFRLKFDVWKPLRIPTFAKSKPGKPNISIAVISSRSTALPSLTQLVSLLESAPWDPPPAEWTGPQTSYQRLKHGYRNLVLAVVDGGIISFLRMSEAAFGEETLYSRFDGSLARGAPKGGGRGRGKGRVRGRGR